MAESKSATNTHSPAALPGVEDQAYWQAIAEEDAATLWHPYTSMVDPLPAYVVRRAEGVTLELADGRKLIDGMSSWWAAIHGYNVPELNAAATAQLEQMSHVMFGGLTHAPAVELGRELLALAPDNMKHIFYADSGSVSVEVALKMAMQYQMAAGHPKRTKVLGFLGGYHGDTAGAMAVCDPVGGMHHIFQGIVAQHIFAERPAIPYDGEWDPAEGTRLRAIIDAHAEEIAAVFVEPIVQGAGGMWMYHPEYLRVVREACDAHDILLVADEIATGFGRTGTLWGCDHAGIQPDILCIGKALTGGYLTLAATMTTSHVAQVMAKSEAGVLMHGPTFMGNPLAVSIARASVKLFRESPWQARVAHITEQLREGLEGLRTHQNVKDVRVLGAIGVVQMTENVNVSALQEIFVRVGAWIRPFRDLIYVMPPYIITDTELRTVLRAITIGVKDSERENVDS